MYSPVQVIFSTECSDYILWPQQVDNRTISSVLVILLGQKAQRLLLHIWLLCKSKFKPHETSNLHNSHEELKESQKQKWVPKGSACMLEQQV